MDYKNLHIGDLLQDLCLERNISLERACEFFQCSNEELNDMLCSKSIETDKLLQWSKLLNYDFFRIYSQHLILFSPKSARNRREQKKTSVKSKTPSFKKNVYTKEIIDYLLGLIKNGEKTPKQIIQEYNIPKTTLYRWVQKYNS